MLPEQEPSSIFNPRLANRAVPHGMRRHVLYAALVVDVAEENLDTADIGDTIDRSLRSLDCADDAWFLRQTIVSKDPWPRLPPAPAPTNA